jgi:cytochrome c oxidase subunit 3
MDEGTLTMEMQDPSSSERTGKMVLYIGIFSIVMLFAGLSSAYVVTSYGELWVNIAMPTAFYISTVLILLSSFTARMAVKASEQKLESRVRLFLGITLLLGLGFGVSQYLGWAQLTGSGSYFSGHVDNLNGVYGEDYTISFQGQELVYENGDYYYPSDDLREKPLTDEISIYGNSASSYIYILSFMHLLHLLGGILFFVVIYLVGQFGKRGTISPLRLKLGTIYWHFVDGLWIYLFLFLLFIH